MIHLVTKQSVLESIPERWRHEHAGYNHGHWIWKESRDEEIYARMIQSQPLTPADVTDAFGGPNGAGDSWLDLPICEHCGKSRDKVFVFVAQQHTGANDAILCECCIREALAMADKAVS